uniref:Uncharacterized protein n=1 Tax=Euplotes harpa TaxID=151035 RepID=A0A7S3JIP0_9SPIT|mmetsp:Transcript_42489/g.49573  ORF Transcript_42489/g.49573 Transcript_42489/m.49573 type:complete len:183 (+) Transcript_42489:1646-2194(+)
MVRLQISFTDFFSTIGNTNFIDRLTSALGITQDKLKIVRVYEGSTIVEWYITSSQSTSTQRQKELKELVDKSLALYNSGSLNLGAPILDFTSQMVTSSGTVVTTNSGTYTKKEINAAVIVILSFAALAMLIAVVVGIIKAIKMSKGYNEIVNMDISEFDKGEHKINISEESKDDHKFEPKQS